MRTGCGIPPRWTAFITRLVDAGADASIGSVADAYDALAETTVGSFKNELIRRQGPWRDVEHIEIGTLNWADWFNNDPPREYLADLNPAETEALHYRRKNSLAPPGDSRNRVPGHAERSQAA